MIGISPIAGQRRQQGGLLARHQRARSLPDTGLAAEVGAQHQVAREPVGLCLTDRRAQPLDGQRPIAPDRQHQL
jgi:hypothetical protein